MPVKKIKTVAISTLIILGFSAKVTAQCDDFYGTIKSVTIKKDLDSLNPFSDQSEVDASLYLNNWNYLSPDSVVDVKTGDHELGKRKDIREKLIAVSPKDGIIQVGIVVTETLSGADFFEAYSDMLGFPLAESLEIHAQGGSPVWQKLASKDGFTHKAPLYFGSELVDVEAVLYRKCND